MGGGYHIYMCVCVCVYIYMYIHIYIAIEQLFREREVVLHRQDALPAAAPRHSLAATPRNPES